MMPALNAGAVSVLPSQMLAQGAGTINFVRQLGGAFGVSLLSAATEVRFAFHADALAATQTAGNHSTAELIDRIGSIEEAFGVPDTQTLAGGLNYLGQVLAAQAQTLAYGDSFAIAGIVFWAGILPALWMRARR